MPPMEVRVALLQFLANAPRDLLEALASESSLTLESVGLGLPAAPPEPAKPAPVVLPANAQAAVDDALREAAEEADVAPKVLRPALSRLLDRLARLGIPMDAAARMVLGVPKKEPAVSPSKTATAEPKG